MNSMQDSNTKYYQMAIEWAEQYISSATERKSMKIECGTITDDIEYLSVSLTRLKESKGAEQRASYNRIRKFKNLIEKTKTLVGEII